MLSPSQSLQYLKGSIERASMCTEWILSRFSAYRRLPVKGMPSKSMLHMQKECALEGMARTQVIWLKEGGY